MEKTLLHENARAEAYKFLSECYHVPDEKLLRALESLGKSTKGSFVSELSKNVPAVDGLELLKIEYARLFLGPFKVLVPPYGSVYLEDERRVMGESTIDARKWYEGEKLDILLKEVPDHIAIELEFMYFLVFKQMEAIRNSDSGTAGNYLEKQRSFLKAHLIKWVPEFADRVIDNASLAFYREVAKLTKEFILLEGGGSNEQ